MASPLAGAWEYVDTSGDALWIFSERHYALLFNAKNRKGLSENPSEAEEAAAFRSMVARAGTYILNGSTLTTEADLSRVPNSPPNVFEITRIDDHSLTWRFVRPDGTKEPEISLRKVS